MKLYARIQSTRSAFFPAGFAPQPGERDDDCLRSPSTPAVLTDTLSATRVPAQAPSAGWTGRPGFLVGTRAATERKNAPSVAWGLAWCGPLMQRFPVWPVSVPALSLHCERLLRARPRSACLSPDGPVWKLADSVVEYSWRCFSVPAVSWLAGLIPPVDQAHTAAKQATYARPARSDIAEFRAGYACDWRSCPVPSRLMACGPWSVAG